MKRNILILILVVLNALCSCNRKSGIIKYDWSNKITHQIGEALINDSSLVGQTVCNMYNDYIMCYNNPKISSKHLTCYYVKQDSLIRKGQILGIGKGPNEALMIEALFLNNENKIIFSNSAGSSSSINHYELRLTPLDSIFSPNSLATRSTPIGNTIFKSIPIDSATFLVMDSKNDNSMFGYYRNGDHTVTDLAIDYPDNNKNYSTVVKSIAYIGFLAKNPDRTQYIYSSQFGNYVFLFEFRDNQIRNIKELYNSHPNYSSPDGNNFKMDKFVYGMSPYATKRYVYLKPMQDAQGSWYTKDIFVFDWNGNPIKKISVNKSFGAFVVNQDDTCIYANSIDENTGQDVILKIKL